MHVVLDVLAEPNRRQILDLLVTGERPVGDLVEALGISQPAVSKHLRIMREAGLVASRTDAQRRVYRVSPAPLRQLDQWLEPYRMLWESRIDDLERHLDATAPETTDPETTDTDATAPDAGHNERSTTT
jgi:DNA-binding transcriptional ArsR family regulator